MKNFPPTNFLYNDAPPPLLLDGNSGNNRCDWRYESYLPRAALPGATRAQFTPRRGRQRPRIKTANFIPRLVQFCSLQKTQRFFRNNKKALKFTQAGVRKNKCVQSHLVCGNDLGGQNMHLYTIKLILMSDI